MLHLLFMHSLLLFFLTLYSILFISFSVSSESVLQLQLQASKEALPPMYS